MNEGKLLSALALARRARKLVIGFDAVIDSAKKRETLLVLISTELSPKTAKEAAFHCERLGVPLLTAPISLDEALKVLGKHSGVFGVTDQGFCRLLEKNAKQ